MTAPIVITDCEQGSHQWHMLRLGCTTASNADKIITAGLKATSSAARTNYRNELVAEKVLGQPQNDLDGMYWIERGRELEPEARALYEFDRDVEVTQVAFVFRDETRRCGCSPDWLIGTDGGGEVKCPKPSTHVGYMLDGAVPPKYMPQVQFSLWVTGRAWWDFVSYCPGLPPVIVRVEPDPLWQAAFSEHVPPFLDEVEAAIEQIQAGMPAKEEG